MKKNLVVAAFATLAMAAIAAETPVMDAAAKTEAVLKVKALGLKGKSETIVQLKDGTQLNDVEFAALVEQGVDVTDMLAVTASGQSNQAAPGPAPQVVAAGVNQPGVVVSFSTSPMPSSSGGGGGAVSRN